MNKESKYEYVTSPNSLSSCCADKIKYEIREDGLTRVCCKCDKTISVVKKAENKTEWELLNY